ncbi:hypothetical protein [Candidatus Enterococcus murrayae]|nr:hypothetical protein [Enterococcus sp. MJM16]
MQEILLAAGYLTRKFKKYTSDLAASNEQRSFVVLEKKHTLN